MVKSHAKKLFPRGHPQACGQVDQVCCEAGGLCRNHFADDEVMEVVQSWLKATPKSFFLEGIRKLVDRGKNCVAKQGDYVEK